MSLNYCRGSIIAPMYMLFYPQASHLIHKQHPYSHKEHLASYYAEVHFADIAILKCP